MKINGSLVFDASSASEIQNLRVQKIAGASVPAFTANDAGRVIFVTTTDGGYAANTLYYGSAGANAWVAIATGGNAAALQTEVDAIETSLGSIVNTAGQFVVNQVTGPAFTGSEANLTQLLQALSNYAAGNDTIAELNDVTLTSLASGDYLKYNGTVWANDVLTLADVTDVTATALEVNTALTGITATAAELNVLDGISGTTVTDLNSIAGYAAQGVSATEFGYLNNVTGPIQAQIDAALDLDAGLDSLAAMTGPGFVAVSANGNTFTARSLVAPAAGLTISNTDGAGDSTFALANDLAALEGLGTVGYIVRTGDGTATTRSLSVVSGDLAITGAADGVATDTTFGLATVSQGASGDFLKFTLDTKGRVIGNTPVTQGDITGLVSSVYVDVAGDTMTGNLTMGTGTYITLNSTAVEGTDAVNKAYVDAATSGLSWKQAVVVASTAPATLATDFAAGQTVDGVVLTLGDRILVKDQTATAENGIYVVTAGAPTRALDMNAPAEFDGSAVFVQQGTVNEGTGWTETATVATVGTSPVLFSQFSGGQAFIWGTGLANTGNTVFVNLGAGITELPSDEVGLHIAADKAVQLTSTLAGGQLTFVLDAGSGLEQSATGLKISAAGVTNAMLASPQFTLNGDSGTDSLILGDTLQIRGTSGQGISTLTTESPAGTSTVTITAADASASQKGVASFDATEFSVTAGAVSLGVISNGKLANAFISFAGDTGSDQVPLGETFTFKDGGTHQVGGRLVDATVGANDVTLKIREATASLPGVASFDAGQFTVTAGAVSLNASLDDLNNVAGADSAAEGAILTKGSGTDYVTVSRAALVGSVVLNDVGDVAATHVDGHALVSDGTNWVNQKMYHLHTEGAAATSWTVTHGLGQQYCNVTIVDSTDNVVIPQSIVFTSANALTVTFNTAVAGKVVVMGIA